MTCHQGTLSWGFDDNAWHISFKYYKNGHINGHFLCLSLDLISELLKQTQRPKWHLEAFTGHWVIILALSQQT